MAFAVEGVAYPAHWHNYYDKDILAERLDHINDINAEWVLLGSVFNTSNRYSHDFHLAARSTPDAELRQAINAAHDSGLKVFFKPVVKMDNYVPPAEPNNVDAWFANYTDWMVRYARIAEQTGAEMFSVGNELSGVVGATAEHWGKVIDAVAEVYSGAITYSAQWTRLLDAEAIWAHEEIDVIGVNNWFPVAPVGKNNPTIAEMQAAWNSTSHLPTYVKEAYNYASPMQTMADLAVKYQKPLLHTEAGYPSRNGGAWLPARTKTQPLVSDEKEQADAFKAYFNAFSQVALPSADLDQVIREDSFLLGSFLWRVEPNHPDAPNAKAEVGGHTYEDKLAEAVIRNRYSTDVPELERDTVLIDARGDGAGGQQALMQVMVDGVVYGQTFVTKNTKTYSFEVPDLTHASSLEIRFPNNAADQYGNDRNLYVLKVVAAGEQLNISDAAYERDGKSTLSGRKNMWWEGELNFDITDIDGGGTNPGPVDPPQPPAGVMAEFGDFTTTHTGKWVAFSHTYVNPVVIAVTPSRKELDEVSVRFENITSNGFRAVLDEPSNRDGVHVAEDVSYMVIEAGTWILADGTKLQAGTTVTDTVPKEGFARITFDEQFDATPVVLTQLQTFNGGDFANARKKDVSTTGFRVAIEEQESLENTRHTDEKIGWLAIEEGRGIWSGHRYFADVKQDKGSSNVTSQGFGSAFNQTPELFAQAHSYNGADPISTRYQKVTKYTAGVVLQEDQTADAETAHGLEDLDIFAIQGQGVLSADLWI